jgi:hypothetical protein
VFCSVVSGVSRKKSTLLEIWCGCSRGPFGDPMNG